MKSFELLLIKSLILLITVSFNMPHNNIPQDNDQEKQKVVKVKIAKKDGNVIIDTIYIVKSKDIDGFNLKEELKKAIDIELEDIDQDELLKDVYITINDESDLDLDSDNEANVMIWTNDGDDGTISGIKLKTVSGKENIIYLETDGENIEFEDGYAFVIKSDTDSSNLKMSIVKASGNESMINIFTNETGGEKITVIMHTLDNSSLDDKDKEVLKEAGIELSDQQFKLDNLVLFPNPNEGEFSLSFETETKDKLIIKVVDLQGKIVHQETYDNFTGKYNKKINLKKSNEGTYFLIIQHGKRLSAHKIIYKK